jgi:hypothetical protein
VIYRIDDAVHCVEVEAIGHRATSYGHH